MKIIATLIFMLILSSCSLKEAADNGFKTKTKVTPMATSKTLAERFGDGKNIKFTIKVPLTEDSIGYFDVEDVLGNSDLNSDHKNFVEKIYDSLKLSMFNLFVKMGYSNKIKFSSVFKFPQINKKYIKSAKVKKVFFTTEDCRASEDDCNNSHNSSSSFNLVDKFFVNVSKASVERGTQSSMTEIEDEEFKDKTEFAFSQTSEKISNILTRVNKDNKISGEINLVKYANDVPYLNLDIKDVPEDSKYLFFKTTKNRKAIKNYLKSDRFKHLIKKVKSVRKGIEVKLVKGTNPNEIFRIIENEKSPLAKRMFILRLDSDYAQAKKYFSSNKFKGIVTDTTMIGKSLYIEVTNDKKISKFKSMLDTDQGFLNSKFAKYKMDRCVRSNCLDLEVKDVNLVSLLEKDPMVVIDTYLSVRDLGNSDFKYNGFIEVEVLLELPL